MNKWYDRLQGVYSSIGELLRYNRIYGVVRRLGYSDANKLWEDNPMLCGSADPKDFGVAKANDDAKPGLLHLRGVDELAAVPVLLQREGSDCVVMTLFPPHGSRDQAATLAVSRGAEGNWLVGVYPSDQVTNAGADFDVFSHHIDDGTGTITLLSE